MRWKLKTAPAKEPIDINEALKHCNLGGVATCLPEDASYVLGLIAKARNFVEQATDRQLIEAVWEAFLDCLPTGKAVLEIRGKLPVISVESIAYTDTEGAGQVFDPADYQVDVVDVDRPARIMPALGKVWPSTSREVLNGATFTLKCGYGAEPTDVPESIRTGLLYLIAQMYAVREPISTMRVERVPGNALELAIDLMTLGIYPS